MPSDDQLLQLALDYFKAWESRNLERIASFLSDDAQIYNLPTPPPQSKSEWEKSTAEFMKNCTGVIFEVKHVAVGKGGVVFSERVDKLELGGKWIEVAVAGVMEFNDEGKIKTWNEYWDMLSLQKQMAP